MIEETAFYHGAALMQVLADERCAGVRRQGPGYLANDDRLLYLKYTTKKRTPWRFAVGISDLLRLREASATYPLVCIGLVCGGDGICAVTAGELIGCLLGDKAGWISVRRAFHEQYEVAGSGGALHHRVSLQRWPSLIFDSITT